MEKRLEIAASLGHFRLALKCPFKLQKSGEVLTEEDMEKFAKERDLNFIPNFNIVGSTFYCCISFEKQ